MHASHCKLKPLDISGHEMIGAEFILSDLKGNVLQRLNTDVDGPLVINADSLYSPYNLRFKYLNSETLNIQLKYPNSLDTLIFLADHIPYYESGRIDTFKISRRGRYIQDLSWRKTKFKAIERPETY